MFTVVVPGVAILVEGESDREAMLALMAAHRFDVPPGHAVVVAMGGITNITRYVAQLGPMGTQFRLTGLYDSGEERFVRRGLQLGGFTPAPGYAGLSALGFDRCDRDLEDELIRAPGIDRVLSVVEQQRALDSFRTLQQQPAHRGRPISGQLHRFFGAGSGRKVRYGRLLAAALGDAEIPAPLAAVLADAFCP